MRPFAIDAFDRHQFAVNQFFAVERRRIGLELQLIAFGERHFNRLANREPV